MSHGYEYNLGLRFQAIVDQYSERTALRFDQTQILTYGDLNHLANRMARWLLSLGAKPRDVVCLSGTKTLYTYTAILACLKIGAAYAVLDPDSPTERLRKIIGTCRPSLLLAEDVFLDRLRCILDEHGVILADMGVEKLAAVLEGFSDSNLPQTGFITGESIAYIMYTSGSTGFPKGAAMTHANVLNLINWGRITYGITPEDVQTNVNPLYFDNSVFDFYSSIFNGSCLIPFTKEEVQDPKKLVEKIDENSCTLWFSVPSLLIFLQNMKATDGRYLRTIRCFIFGGEGYPKAKLKKLYDVYSNSSEFHNVYGPTECTCICSSYKIKPDDFENMHELMPLGFIAENFDYLILNDEGEQVTEGDFGELCLLGPNVGKGYYNDPVRTDTSFIQNPSNSSYKERMYKTGDLVHLNPDDGKLYIQGRKDNQIKHMGYRIELEEIESSLYCLDYITEASAVHGMIGGLSRIFAVVVTHNEVTDEQIRQDLRQVIPDYMVPSTIFRVDTLPKNPNGKVDRRKLVEKYFSPNI